MNARYPWKLGTVWFFALLLASSLFALTACQKDQTTPPQGQNQNQGDQAANPPAAQVQLVPISYTEADKENIRNTAKFTGVASIYVPQKAVPDDKIDQVQGNGKVMTVKFKHMAVLESPEELRPPGQESEKEVKLSIGTADWLTVNGQRALYLKQGDTFIAIQPLQGTAPEAIEAIAETLAPLE
ncbi:hypothetical protein [Paenibacillus naphthalenovorans]|uniref:hypothetical protein n=1 Tax=Paenibacillus naphthalenovorans TaxID=162209 RepID=UPI000886CAED|nr:hypothetical protein [Paenibacillus naphthalenovorans]SDI10331.1 hypothetical protein SAMN05421868_103127 [Paenibacillus naphthalenovorans]